MDKILTQHITFPNDVTYFNSAYYLPKIRMDAMFLKNCEVMNKEPTSWPKRNKSSFRSFYKNVFKSQIC